MYWVSRLSAALGHARDCGNPDWGELGLIAKTTGAALITADLLSVLIFPLLELTLLRRGEADSLPVQKQSEA